VLRRLGARYSINAFIRGFASLLIRPRPDLYPSYLIPDLCLFSSCLNPALASPRPFVSYLSLPPTP
jgi:hypothetical protein